MDIYVVGIYFLVMSLLMGQAGPLLFFSVALIILTMIIIWRREKRLLYLVFGAVFLLRALTGVEFHGYRVGERVGMVVESSGRRTQVRTIEGRLPRERIYISGVEVGRGKYRLEAEIMDIEESRGAINYRVEALDRRRIDESIVRGYLERRIDNLLEGYSRDLKDFYRGVIAGDKDGLDRELREKFSYTGTSHLIVISGLHIGVIIALILYLAGKIPIGHDERYIGIIVVLSLYVLAVGPTPSVVRAYIMGVCYLGSGLLYEESDGRKSFFTAMTINLLLDPLGAGRISFQLSYMAVFSILFIYPVAERYLRKIENLPLRWFASMASLSLVIQVALTPIFAMNFRSIPLLSFLVNVVAIPLGTLFVQAAFLALLTSNIGLGFLIMPTVNLIYYILVTFIGLASNLPLLSVEYRGVSSSLCLIFIYLTMILFSFRRTRVWSLLPMVLIVLMNRERGDDYLGRKYAYYSGYPRVVAVEKKLTMGDLEEMWDSRIKGVEVVVAGREQDERVIGRLDPGEILLLERGKSVRVGDRRFENIEGKIVVRRW
ncbi:hypothetical protein PM10SUCC1_15990 [Propionigenium maris DSM 9537]|uniref:ComEC/Rec2-related protein domain-containing protein n=1 Tax=Propionigenium maris DSM 9537 TaxID=1123000 RepID=A0A9W6GLD6_9FUSO|nr:ComEC/Rec2 family competence protein [Propionigenium maris]GLI56085.1 hypothetical protein PM10SUCC1_15990 [Propionigenium maris DSM 9537]